MDTVAGDHATSTRRDSQRDRIWDGGVLMLEIAMGRVPGSDLSELVYLDHVMSSFSAVSHEGSLFVVSFRELFRGSGARR
jgi:hypothetical protein